MSNARILVEDYADVTVVTFQDSSILEMKAIEQIGASLYELVEKQAKKKLVLDFTNVKFLASHTIGVLLNLQKKCKAINGQMVICAVKKDLMKLFTITSLDKILKFFPDDAAALKHFNVHVS